MICLIMHAYDHGSQHTKDPARLEVVDVFFLAWTPFEDFANRQWNLLKHWSPPNQNVASVTQLEWKFYLHCTPTLLWWPVDNFHPLPVGKNHSRLASTAPMDSCTIISMSFANWLVSKERNQYTNFICKINHPYHNLWHTISIEMSWNTYKIINTWTSFLKWLTSFDITVKIQKNGTKITRLFSST